MWQGLDAFDVSHEESPLAGAGGSGVGAEHFGEELFGGDVGGCGAESGVGCVDGVALGFGDGDGLAVLGGEEAGVAECAGVGGHLRCVVRNCQDRSRQQNNTDKRGL